MKKIILFVTLLALVLFACQSPSSSSSDTTTDTTNNTKTYTVTIDVNGGNPLTKSSYQVKAGETLTITETPTQLLKKVIGYIDLTGNPFVPGLTAVNNDIKIIAQWSDYDSELVKKALLGRWLIDDKSGVQYFKLDTAGELNLLNCSIDDTSFTDFTKLDTGVTIYETDNATPRATCRDASNIGILTLSSSATAIQTYYNSFSKSTTVITELTANEFKNGANRTYTRVTGP